MAAGNFTLYSNAKLLAFQAGLNLSTASANLFGVLVVTAYTPAATHSTYADISANEATGTAYTAGGQALTSVSLTQTSGTVTFTSASATWSASTITARYFVIVRRASAGTAASTDPLVGYVDLTGGGSLSSTAGSFTVNPNASGWFTAT